MPFTMTVDAAVANRADVKAVVAGPARAAVGSKVTYTLTVTNSRPAAATGLTSVLSTSGLTGLTASTGGVVGTVTICGVTLAGLTWYLPSLASGQSATYTLTGTVGVRKGSYVTTLGGATSFLPDPNTLNHIAAFSTKAS